MSSKQFSGIIFMLNRFFPLFCLTCLFQCLCLDRFAISHHDVTHPSTARLLGTEQASSMCKIQVFLEKDLYFTQKKQKYKYTNIKNKYYKYLLQILYRFFFKKIYSSSALGHGANRWLPLSAAHMTCDRRGQPKCT